MKALTLYQVADTEIRLCIESYLKLAGQSSGLTKVRPSHLTDNRARLVLLAGLGMAHPTTGTAAEAHAEWKRRGLQGFDLETGVTAGVYIQLRSVVRQYYQDASRLSRNFTFYAPELFSGQPHLLPIFQHVGGIFSKSKMKKLVGNVSDLAISQKSAGRLAAFLSGRMTPRGIDEREIMLRLEATFEGIVRDLVGRVLLESVVEAALIRQKLPFVREKSYQALAGVVYDFRADFVLPNARAPQAFIEVRKSSSRHASLYAKDKMFSAINWKGKNKALLAVLVVDGDWTKETLRVMADVYDYVVPLHQVNGVAKDIGAYLNGDKTKLKWVVDFFLSPAGVR